MTASAPVSRGAWRCRAAQQARRRLVREESSRRRHGGRETPSRRLAPATPVSFLLHADACGRVHAAGRAVERGSQPSTLWRRERGAHHAQRARSGAAPRRVLLRGRCWTKGTPLARRGIVVRGPRFGRCAPTVAACAAWAPTARTRRVAGARARGRRHVFTFVQVLRLPHCVPRHVAPRPRAADAAARLHARRAEARALASPPPPVGRCALMCTLYCFKRRAGDAWAQLARCARLDAASISTQRARPPSAQAQHARAL